MGRAEMERARAVQRYRAGESVGSICASLGRSRRWLYKWLERESSGGQSEWSIDRSRRPQTVANRTEATIEQMVLTLRHRLIEEHRFCGAQAIAWELEDLGIHVPAIATINRILQRNGVVEGSTTRLPSKHRRYPAPSADDPGSVHQSDFVGPRFLRGPVRFYSLNTVDLATSRCATIPLRSRDTEAVAAFWAVWNRLGIPRVQQLDNELVFFGSRLHPRALSQVLRLCLLHDVEPLFIPPAEPWRNGVVEKFNDHWQQKFLVDEISDFGDLQSRSLVFDDKHNGRWRYQKNGGRTPLQMLTSSRIVPRLPPSSTPPPMPLRRPTAGRYHFIRFIRSDRILNMFGERFALPSEAVYEYVKATVDVSRECLEIRLGNEIIDTQHYPLPKK